MARYLASIDDVVDGAILGAVIDLDNLSRRVCVQARTDRGHMAAVIANLPHQPSIDADYGDGRYGFVVDLASHISESDRDLEITVSVADDGYELPGSPLRITIGPAAVVDRCRGGVIVGWAHGKWFSETHVELWSGDTFLFEWPANDFRLDLHQAGIGDGRNAFYIPLRWIFGDAVPPELNVRLSGSASAPINVPPDVSSEPPGMNPARATSNAYQDLEYLYSELLAQTAKPRLIDALKADEIEVSFVALQSLLDMIAQLHDKRQTLHALEKFRSMGATPKSVGVGLSAMCGSSASSGEAANVERAERHIIEPFLTDPAFRALYERRLAETGDAKVLTSVARAFRRREYLEHAAVAMTASILNTPTPQFADVREQRHFSSWAHMLHASAVIIPRPTICLPRGRPRALYALWRSVPYDTNGYATRSHYLLRGLTETGADVIGCTRLGYPSDAETPQSPASLIETVDGIRYVHIGDQNVGRDALPLDTYIQSSADRMAHVAAAAGVDIIHAASNWLSALPALLAARKLGLPFVYEMRGLWEVTRASSVPGYDRTDHFKLFEQMETFVTSHADMVFTITTGVRDEMQRRGCNVDAFRLAPNGVDINRFKIIPRDAVLAARLGIGDEPVLGFIGTFAAYEGLVDLIRAAAVLAQRGIVFRLLLVGDGPALPAVQEQIGRLGLRDHVVITGRVPFADVPKYYSLINVAVYPRRGVPITEMVSPLKPFEAMAMGKPVVASNVAAMADIVRHNETGWLFEKNDLDALTGALDYVIRNTQMCARAGAAARLFIEKNHTWTDIARQVANGWDEVRRRAAERTRDQS